MGAFDKLGLLIWKNFLLQKRRPIATVIELLLPVFYTIILVIIRNEIEVTEHVNMTTWSEFSVDSLPEFSVSSLPENYKWTIAYAPDNDDFFHNVMEEAKTKLNQVPLTRTEQKCGIDIPSFLQIMENPMDAMTLLSEASANPRPAPPGNGIGRRNFVGPAMLSAAVQSTYNSFPPPLQSILEDMAEENNSTAQDFLTEALLSGDVANFTADLLAKFFNKTIECFLGDLQGMFDRQNNSSSSNSNDRNNDEESKNPMENVTMTDMFSYFSTVPKVDLMPFPSHQAFLDYVQNETNLNAVLAGVMFSGGYRDFSVESDNLHITLRFQADPLNSGSRNPIAGGVSRWVTHLLFPSFQVARPRSANDPTGGRPGYYKEGFLSLQHAVYSGIAATLANDTLPQTSFALKRYPYPPYVEDSFIIAIQRTLPMIIMLSFIYTSLVIVRSVVLEKESKMKEYMMMMGLSNWLHWLAWFIKYIIFLCISCIVMAALFKVQTPYGSVLTYSDATVVFLFLLLFSAANITLSFFISTFFSKANVGAAAGGVLYGLTYMPYLYMQNIYDQLDISIKLLSCVLPNLAMSNVCQLLAMFEGAGIGVHWYNLNTSVSVDDNFTVLQVFLMLIFDCFFFMFLTWYIEGILPGDYGIPKPWYFPFMKSYWTGMPQKSKSVKSDDIELANMDVRKNGDFFENEPTHLAKTVEIKNLKKIFNAGGKTKVAVNNLSLNMYEGQINVLLGHNGAGKTTTMSILTGFFPPTSGEASVMGHSIITDMAGVRKSLGLCPQFNILFDLLTVDEHLYFFARLKGLDKKEAGKCVEEMRNCLKLNDKANAKSHTLSGGMKRKLSVGIALSAGSKYVILDEPTSGMDPAARRAIWEVIQEYRSKCSMLLSTHFMDEADLLGDWISIMADGKLRCAGSSVFLKNKFGVGYHAILTKTQDCDVAKLNDFFHSFVPDCHLERTAGGEVSFLLPFHSSSRFPKLFEALEENSTELGVTNFGATVTTLEEVFLRVTEDAETAVEAISKRISTQASAILVNQVPDSPTASAPVANRQKASNKYNTGFILWFQQFYGLFVKHLLHSRRNYKVVIAQILVPVVFGALAILQVKYPPFVQDNVPLDLSLNAYGESFVYTTASDGSTTAQELSDVYLNQFKGPLITESQLTGDLEEYICDTYEAEGGNFNSRNLISATFEGDDSTNTSHAMAWFNNQAYHTPATSLAYLDQSYIRYVTNRHKYDITLTNSPLERKTSDRVQEELVGSMSGFLMAFNIVLGFSFLAASFCLFLVRERVDRSSLLQTLAGVDPFCFWLSAFAWDFVNFITPCLITMIMFAAFSIEELNSHAGIVLLLFVLYCWATLPLMYALSFLFVIPSTALVRVTILNMITGLASILSVNILILLQLTDIANTLNWVFLFLPQYCVGQGLSDIYTNHKMVNVCTESSMMEQMCDESNITYQLDYLAWESYGVGKYMTFLGIQGVIFFGILVLVEFDYLPYMWKLFCAAIKWMFSKLVKRNQTLSQAPSRGGSKEDDEDVVSEKERLNGTSLDELFKTDRLIIHNLRKVYDSAPTPLVAVDSLCIGIPGGECFGLLGINGAGKTTTFKMLSGDYKASSGTAYLEGFDINKNLRQVQQRLGYCPQWDGLIEQMTGAETLRMFARLRGVPEVDIPSCIQHLGKSLHFAQHLHKSCGTYSGGNKRKLSTAIALVGNPPVVLLDEPSTGMDPGARRMLWDALADIRASGCSIVITSHSMEECEALCTRLAIMVNGQLRCLGGPQHLKNRFGQGYTIEMKMPLSLAHYAPVQNYMNQSFPGCNIKDAQQGLVTCHVAQFQSDGSPLKLSKVFGLMEASKSAVGVTEYTVSQTTLEQVFLSLVRWQRETTDDDNAQKSSQ